MGVGSNSTPTGMLLARGDGEHPVDLKRTLRLVRRQHGKSSIAQIAEMVRLVLGPGKITPAEYYTYCLYDDRSFTREAKRAFLGRRAQIALNHLCNDPAWRAIAGDKVIFADAMQAHGFSIAKTVALYHDFRTLGSGRSLRDLRQLSEFMRSAKFPLFSKPVGGMFSVGAARLQGFDPQSNELALTGIGNVQLELYSREIEHCSRRYGGYLFQELLHPHEQIEEICGDRIASVRFVVLLHESGPEIVRAAWKIPTGGNIADNFWRPGNLLASLDRETGRVIRVVRGVGPEQTLVDRHPDTGCLIAGTSHPQWQQMRELCLAAAATLPGLRIQAWDVALCREGPILQEVNIGGSYRLQQTADGAGMLDATFRHFLDRQFPGWPSRTTWFMLRRSVGSRLARALRRRKSRGSVALP